MKIQKIFWALMVMALPLGIIGCSNKDEEGGGGSDETPYKFEEPAQKADAATFDIKGDIQVELQGDTPGEVSTAKLEKATFGEGGDCVLQFTQGGEVVVPQVKTRAEEETVYLAGKYTKSGTTYTIYINGQKWGTISLGNAASDGSVTLTVQQEGKAATEGTATQEAAMPSNDKTALLCRSWKPFRTRLNFKKSTVDSWIADELPGADFQAIKERVEKEGCKIKDDFGNGYTVSSIFFTQTGTFCIAFTNGKNYVGNWSWANINNGDLTYKWNDENNMGCEYESGNAHIDIYTTDVYKGECWLRLTNTIKNGDTNWDFQLIFRLTP